MIQQITPALNDQGSTDAGEDWTGVARVADDFISGSCVVHESGIFVLTAGHVIESLKLTRSEVTFDVNEETDTRDVIGAITFPNYGITNFGAWHDIGLLVLDQAAPLDAERYELYRDRDEIGQEVDLVGYGGSTERQAGENEIQSLATEIMQRGSLRGQLVFDADTGAMITPGDSGGGMFIQDKDPLLAGIHSYTLSTDLDSDAEVGVSTRISFYTKWIDRTTGVVQSPETYSTNPPSTDSVPVDVFEGEGVWFMVQLGSPCRDKTSVNFHTLDGSATAGEDYVPTQGTLTFESGEQWSKIWVQTLADDILEGEESFSLVLSDPQGVPFPQGVEELTAERTIVDDVSLAGVTELQSELYFA